MEGCEQRFYPTSSFMVEQWDAGTTTPTRNSPTLLPFSRNKYQWEPGILGCRFGLIVMKFWSSEDEFKCLHIEMLSNTLKMVKDYVDLMFYTLALSLSTQLSAFQTEVGHYVLFL